MEEFKGTKGKWVTQWNGFYFEVRREEDFIDGKNLSISSFLYDTNNNGDRSGTDENKANALLISKAPEMLEKLESSLNVIKWYMENSIPDENHEDFFNIGMNQREELKQLIKEATEG